MFSDIKRLLDGFEEKGIPAFDLIIYHKGRCVFRDYRGHSDYEGKTRLYGSEKYNFYSASKLATVTAALTLVESGDISLDDPLHLYLPEFRDARVKTPDGVITSPEPIRIEHLFSMTAGFDYEPNAEWVRRAKAETGGRCPTRRAVSYLADEPLCFTPGECFKYSFSHDVLAAVVEAVSGMRFGRFAASRIFAPLGMMKSSYGFSESADERVAQYFYNRREHRYERRACGKEVWTYKFGEEYESGGAGLISTAEDYIKLLESLRRGEILRPDTVALLEKNRLNPVGLASLHRMPDITAEYGYSLGAWCGMRDSREFGWAGAGGVCHTVNRELEYSMVFTESVFYAPNYPTFIPLNKMLFEIFSGKK